MCFNPEFRRNTWTDFTLKNVLVLPILLITVYFLAYTVSADKTWSIMPRISLVFYIMFTYIWGTRKTSETVVKELNNNTWSFQVMTPMSPAQMAFGKLFGSTAFVWYANLICMILYVIGIHIDADKIKPITNAELVQNISIFVLLGLVAHILPLLISLHSIRWRHFFERFDLSFYQLTGFLAVIPLYLAMFSRFSTRTFMWYGEAYSLKALVIIFSLIFLAWAFLSIVNQMKTEFGQEPYPISWILFVLTLIIVLFGFNNYASNNILVRYYGTILALFATVSLTYITLAGESNMALRPHMVFKYYKTKQYKRLFTIMPRTLVVLPIIIILALVLLCQFSKTDSDISKSSSYVVAAMILFMMRDFCLVYVWSLFSKGNEKATTVIPVFIVLATYSIIPSMLSNLHLNFLIPIFIPYFHENPEWTFNQTAALTVIPALAWFLVMFGILIKGIIRKKRQLEQDTEFSYR
jgi:hypothetical protein